MPHPGQAVMKTLTDITPYTDYVEKLSSLFVNENEDDEEEQAVAYPAYSEADFLNDVYMDEDEYVVLVDLIRNKKNVILQGAPWCWQDLCGKTVGLFYDGCERSESCYDDSIPSKLFL